MRQPRHKTAWAPLVIALLLTAGCASTPAPRTAPAPAAPSAAPSAAATPPPNTRAEEARRAEFDAALSRWHGATLTELQAKLGKPDTVTRQADGSSVYAYTRTGASKFSCTVRYLVDDKTRQVRSHSIEGC